MKELLQGRRFGFAPRPLLGQVALGIAIAATIVDLMAWFAWGARQTNGFVVAAYWLTIAAAIVTALATIAALAETRDVSEEDAGPARIDAAATAVATVILAASAALRGGDLAAAGAAPAPFLMSIAAVVILLVDGVIASTLYAGREWETVEDDDELLERRRRRRTATR